MKLEGSLIKWGTKTKRPEDHIFPQFNKLKDQKHLTILSLDIKVVLIRC